MNKQVIGMTWHHPRSFDLSQSTWFPKESVDQPGFANFSHSADGIRNVRARTSAPIYNPTHLWRCDHIAWTLICRPHENLTPTLRLCMSDHARDCNVTGSGCTATLSLSLADLVRRVPQQVLAWHPSCGSSPRSRPPIGRGHGSAASAAFITPVDGHPQETDWLRIQHLHLLRFECRTPNKLTKFIEKTRPFSKTTCLPNTPKNTTGKKHGHPKVCGALTGPNGFRPVCPVSSLPAKAHDARLIESRAGIHQRL